MKMSIRKRLLATTLLIAALSLLFSGAMIYTLLQRELLSQAIDSDRDKQTILCNQLNAQFNGIEHIGKQIIIDQTVQDYLKQSERARLRNTRELTIRLQAYLTLQDYLHSIVLIDNDGKAYWTQIPYDGFDAAYLDEEWYRTDRSGKDQPYFTGVHLLFSQNVVTGHDVISYVMSIRDINHPVTIIGEVVINVYADYFKKTLFSSQPFDGISLLNEHDERILGAGEDHDFSAGLSAGAEPFIADDRYYLSAPLDNGWRVLSAVRIDRYRPHFRTMMIYFILFAALSLLLIFASIIPLQLSITRPLETLSRTMKRVMEGDMEVNAEVHSGDEIEMLSHVFNRMLSEVRFYIDTAICHEKEKRKLEMQLLLEQINPHFIYNTLNAIIYLAHKHDDDSIEKMTRAFIQLLRESVQLGQQSLFNTVDKEVDMICLYLEIMRYRIEAPYDVEIDIAPEIGTRIIPRTILQPLVENALYHGLLPKKTHGHIRIAIRDVDEGLAIHVQDDGVGMEPEKVYQLIKNAPNGDRMYKIGIYNVKSRLDLLYERKYSLDIHSTPGHGTSVQIILHP